MSAFWYVQTGQLSGHTQMVHKNFPWGIPIFCCDFLVSKPICEITPESVKLKKSGTLRKLLYCILNKYDRSYRPLDKSA